ncbi:MAG TPA: hypothetical protein VE863_19680 [Pyrinomonadaceae bacterium]|jgi:hypothetical protein|nr:hypothetical protein [Pyrinomonadaceae bacterium]
MTNLKRLGATVVLVVGLTLAAYADCPAPGIMNGPPCASAAQAPPADSTQDESTAPGIMNGPPAASEAALPELASLAEFALNALMLF